MSAQDLSRPLDVGEILGGAFRLYRQRFGLFAAIALAVVIPVDLLVYGVWGELLWSNDDFADSLPTGAAIASFVAPVVVLTPLITAAHVLAVMELAEGGNPTAGGALRGAARRFPSVALAVTLYWLCIMLGTLFFILPGVYLYVRLFVTPQAVVAEDRTGGEGLSRSSELVEGHWWRVFGVVILIGITGFLLGAILGLPALAVGAVVGSGLLTLLGQILLDAVIYSFAALAGTLLFFDLKARRLPPNDLDAPERPY